MSADEQLSLPTEIIKLLLQVAWADDGVERSETKRILDFAHASGLSEAQLEEIEGWLAGAQRLPAPNLGFLGQHRAAALAAARSLAGADGHVSDDEQEMLVAYGTLLRQSENAPVRYLLDLLLDDRLARR